MPAAASRRANSANSSRSRVQPKRYGSETPRGFTPPLRRLTPKTSLGFAVIEFAEVMLEMTLFPWQKWLLIHMLELLPDNSMRFRTVLILVARQNGKSTLSQVLALWFMYRYHVALVLGTAQDLDVAEEIWQGAVDLIKEVDEFDEPLRPELFALLDRVVATNGKKALVLTTGERYKVKAANRRAGRGLSGDLILLDELREHQSWDAWGAITKTTMARAHALILALSNAGDDTSVVLNYLRKLAHAALGDPDGINAEDEGDDPLPGLDEVDLEVEIDDEDTLAIFEWSLAPDADINDRDGWGQPNPSLGYANGIAEKTIASAVRTDPEPVLRTEVMCQHVKNLDPWKVVRKSTWDALEDLESRIAVNTPVVYAAGVDESRGWGSISKCGRREDGLLHIELVDRRPGTAWMVSALSGLTADAWSGSVVIDDHGPAASLITELEAAGVPIQPTSAQEFARACGQFYDAVTDAVPTIRHLGQIELATSLGGSEWRPLGDARALVRKGLRVDPEPIITCALAASGFVEQFVTADASAFVL